MSWQNIIVIKPPGIVLSILHVLLIFIVSFLFLFWCDDINLQFYTNAPFIAVVDIFLLIYLLVESTTAVVEPSQPQLRQRGKLV